MKEKIPCRQEPVIIPPMRRVQRVHVIVFCALFLSGCSQAVEVSKTVWGSSTRALDHARVEGVSKSYDCTIDDCFDVVLLLDRTNRSELLENKEYYTNVTESPGVFDIFIKDRLHARIIVMGIEGNVNTTEVGIFFERDNLDMVRVDVSSLSSSAKRKVADAVFNELDRHFAGTATDR
ncbi:MAG: hypothetical protein KC713_08480 [Candidatus Omnitrophica bacterium]|nr:hypothetical protein [Candidatus Omnitrophota bacterium]